MNSYFYSNNIKDNITQAFQVLKQYSYLLDSFILDFHVEDHWSKLPLSWQLDLEKLNLKEAASLLNNETRLGQVLPLSLIALRELSNLLSIPRKSSSQESETNKNEKENLKGKESICLRHPKLANLFNKHVKPKKRHEISKMAKICAEMAEKTGCDYVIDVGSGLGHLGRALAFGYEMKVCCLEAQNNLTQQAKKLDTEMEVLLRKYLTEEEMSSFHRPVHLNKRLENNTNEHDLRKYLKESFDLKREENFGIVGLHPCGDLAAILLRLFNQCPNTKFIILAGCCYMKLTPQFGYPLSKFLTSKSNTELSYEAREVACHANESYTARLEKNDYLELRVHCYRATLEYIINEHQPNYKHSQIRSVRITPEMQFTEYCLAALSKLSINLPEESMGSIKTKKLLDEWKKVVIFYTLRLLLAPLVETVVLLDRVLFIQELGYQCEIIPAFDPLLSPRNQILIATKN